jgi:hypothetical protein
VAVVWCLLRCVKDLLSAQQVLFSFCYGSLVQVYYQCAGRAAVFVRNFHPWPGELCYSICGSRRLLIAEISASV